MSRRSSASRLGLVAIAVAALAAFAALGGTGLAGSLAKPSKAQYGGQYNNAAKVWVCHRKGNGGSVTIRVSINALPAHKRHGDTEGLCATLTSSAAKGKAKGKAKKTSGETTAATAPSASGNSGKSNNGKAKGKNK